MKNGLPSVYLAAQKCQADRLLIAAAPADFSQRIVRRSNLAIVWPAAQIKRGVVLRARCRTNVAGALRIAHRAEAFNSSVVQNQLAGLIFLRGCNGESEFSGADRKDEVDSDRET